MLAAVVCGLFGAAAATWAAWQTARPVPSVEEARRVFALALPGYDLGEVHRSPALFVVYDQPFGLPVLDDVLFGDGGEYGFGSTSAGLSTIAAYDAEELTAAVTARLRSDGWTVAAPFVEWRDASGAVTESVLMASKDDLVLAVRMTVDGLLNVNSSLGVSLSRGTPWPVYPAAALGGLAAALAGWRLFGWATRRERHPTAGALFWVAMFLWYAPIVLSVAQLLPYHLRHARGQWDPLWEWLGQPTASLPWLIGAAALLLATGLQALSPPVAGQQVASAA